MNVSHLRKLRTVLVVGIICGAFLSSVTAHAAFTPDKDYLADQAALDKLQADAFKYFWEFAEPNSGMAYEANYSWDEQPIAVGGTGFGVAAMVAAVERGLITREEAITRLQKIVLFLRDKTERRELHGAFPHWLNGETGKAMPFGDKDSAADLVETSLLMQGLLLARGYFNGPGVEEKVRDIITELWEDVEWNWFTNGEESGLYWHWDPKMGFYHGLKILGYNECLITYVLAAASPTYPISKKAFDYWWSGVDYFPRTLNGYVVEASSSSGGPLFLAHYSFIGLNPRRLADFHVREGYFLRGVKHTLSNRGYCLYEAPPANKYADDFWGLSASHAKEGYFASDPMNDHGAIAPTAALASMPYTPHYSMEVLRNLAGGLKKRVWGEYGPYDGISHRDEWVSEYYLAIDQLPIVSMVENYRSGLLWRLFMADKDIRRGLAEAGFSQPQFTDGFPEAVVTLRKEGQSYVPDAYEIRRHPDSGLYEIPYFVGSGGMVSFRFVDFDGEELFSREVEASNGANTFSFAQFMPVNKEIVTLQMTSESGEYTLPIRLH